MPRPLSSALPFLRSGALASVAALIVLVSGCAQMPGISPSRADQQANTTEDVRFSQTDRGAMITSSERVLFETGRSEIKADGTAFIDSLVSAAKHHDARLLIEGHTDNVGNEAYNLALSEQRANAVKQALIAQGIPSQRITTVGFGPANPVVNNDSEEGRATNRRTEVILLGEQLENLNRNDFMSNLGRTLTAFLGSLTERLEYKPTPQNFNPNDRIRSVGATTRCGERVGASYLIIDGSSVEPQTLRKGEQAILTTNVQLCVPEGQRHMVNQVIHIRRASSLIATGGKHSFANMERTRSKLFSRITVGDNMSPGTYTVESVLTFGGRAYRQTTPFTVQ